MPRNVPRGRFPGRDRGRRKSQDQSQDQGIRKKALLSEKVREGGDRNQKREIKHINPEEEMREGSQDLNPDQDQENGAGENLVKLRKYRKSKGGLCQSPKAQKWLPPNRVKIEAMSKKAEKKKHIFLMKRGLVPNFQKLAKGKKLLTQQ